VKLVVEIDGLYHGARERLDERRDWALVSAGYHVLRLDVADVMADVEAVVARIGAEVALLR
jgi:very-short-patch-repair endonuclease